jgi:hypothetical protein
MQCEDSLFESDFGLKGNSSFSFTPVLGAVLGRAIPPLAPEEAELEAAEPEAAEAAVTDAAADADALEAAAAAL